MVSKGSQNDYIKAGLNEFQVKLLELVVNEIQKSQIITDICNLFKTQFVKAYEKYVQLKSDLNLEKQDLIDAFEKKNTHLKLIFSEINVDDTINGEEPDLVDTNFTDLVTEQVQVFIQIMRWFIYTFYGFQRLVKTKFVG